MASITVIIPTLARKTLETMLDSIKPQLLEGDEVLVVSDGPRPGVHGPLRRLGPPFRYLEERSAGPNLWGDPQRNFAMKQAKAEYLLFQDDDNVLLPGALDAVRRGAVLYPGRPLIFKVEYWNGRIAPIAPKLIYGDVDTACLAFPNVPARLGHWPGAYGGDFIFARETLRLYPRGERDVVWMPELICIHRPHQRPERLRQLAQVAPVA